MKLADGCGFEFDILNLGGAYYWRVCGGGGRVAVRDVGCWGGDFSGSWAPAISGTGAGPVDISWKVGFGQFLGIASVRPPMT